MILIQNGIFNNKIKIDSSNFMMKKILHYIDLEAVIWIAGFIYLASINPYSTNHFKLCPFDAVGIDFCPGCGLGKSISYIFHGEFYLSLMQHPLGIFAIVVLVARVIKLIKSKYTIHKSEVLNG